MKTLAESDKGSWFNQETRIDSSLSSPSPSTSTRKLEASKQAFLNDSFIVSSDSDSTYTESSEEVDSEEENGDVVFTKPTGNYIVSLCNLQKLLQASAVCKVCNSALQILEKVGSKQGLGAQWSIRCLNNTCTSHILTLKHCRYPPNQEKFMKSTVRQLSVFEQLVKEEVQLRNV